ncbi:ferritin-like domain-containing protein [Acaryochloris marina NIES-2412]|uniref:ferritin-like domain-containing protein n=1 Tax=Acaryochloris marina TaxID=155978 RepID=UPI00405A4116
MLRQNSEHQIFQVFSSPYLELIRLLHEASEIEHALMIQYLYAAFSVYPQYPDISGDSFVPNSLVGTAVEEMQHLGIVSRFLSVLGGSPHLLAQDFPYIQDIYPFPLDLEPLSRFSVAKYTYVEASASAINNPEPEDKAFVKELLAVLGEGIRPNQLGSLYNRILEILNASEELIASTPDALTSIDLNEFEEQIKSIKEEGENEHFLFFKSVFLGNHPAFKNVPNVWDLDPQDPNFPSIDITTNPSAYRGSENQISNPEALQIAFLSNLHYWIILLLLDLLYRHEFSQAYSMAVNHMELAVFPLGKHLANVAQIGLPFDASPIGYNAGKSELLEKALINSLLAEAKQVESDIEVEINGLNSSIYDTFI